MARLSVLLIATQLDGYDVGESLTAFKLVRELSKLADLTVLALECTKGAPLRAQLPNVEVVTWGEPAWLRRHERLRAMLKPNAHIVGRHAQRWIKKAMQSGRFWDLAHQILPRAPRYPSILRHFSMPYVIGSLGGALPTPAAFEQEAGSAPSYTRLRELDRLRLRYDPALRRTYSGAALVIGVAPYMREVLRDCPIMRFESELGIGVDDVAPLFERTYRGGRLNLLHVGRAVRTKGLRDAVRALAHLRDAPGVTLSSVGSGEEIPICRAEAERLGIADRVRFHGALPRQAIEAHYANADLLVYPSFRESMGAVLLEAMRWGVPSVTVPIGGPDYIAGDDRGLKVPLTSPQLLAKDIAAAIRQLLNDPEKRLAMGCAGRDWLVREQLWPVKAKKMLALYHSVIDDVRK